MPTAEQLRILVSNVVEPCTEKPLGDLRMIRDTFVNGNDARVRIELPTPAYPASKKLEELIRQRIKFAAAELEPRIEMHSFTTSSQSAVAKAASARAPFLQRWPAVCIRWVVESA